MMEDKALGRHRNTYPTHPFSHFIYTPPSLPMSSIISDIKLPTTTFPIKSSLSLSNNHQTNPMDEEYSNRPPSSAAGHHHRHPPASTSELMESAKLMAATAKSAVGGDTASINKARVAEAAENLIGAAEKYGKLEGSGIGSYLDKAEDYLHKYHDSSQTTESSAAHGENAAPLHRPQPHRRQEQDEEEDEEPRHGGGGGAGDYLKMAQGFFK